MTSPVTREAWLAEHAYLRPAADLHALVETAARAVPLPSATVPHWPDYADAFEDGVPLLSSTAAPDLSPAEYALTALLEKLMTCNLPGTLSEQPQAIAAELRADSEAPRRAIGWLLDRTTFDSACPGLLRYLGWTVLASHLSAVVAAFSAWRDEERWFRNYCPTCGMRPAMAQLVGTDPGRLRLLSCGHCHTRWRYRRTGCPFCEAEDDHRLAAFAVENDSALRIDYCESCRGYLKTYVGEGSESLLLADWTSLHLDVVARQRELQRFGASLYQL